MPSDWESYKYIEVTFNGGYSDKRIFPVQALSLWNGVSYWFIIYETANYYARGKIDINKNNSVSTSSSAIVTWSGSVHYYVHGLK